VVANGFLVTWVPPNGSRLLGGSLPPPDQPLNDQRRETDPKSQADNDILVRDVLCPKWHAVEPTDPQPTGYPDAEKEVDEQANRDREQQAQDTPPPWRGESDANAEERGDGKEDSQQRLRALVRTSSEPPNGSRSSCGRPTRRRKSSGRHSVPR